MTRWEVLLPNSCFPEGCNFTQVAKKLTWVVMAVTLDHGGLHDGQQPGQPVFVLWQQLRVVLETARRQHALCSAISRLQLELSNAGSRLAHWERIHG